MIPFCCLSPLLLLFPRLPTQISPILLTLLSPSPPLSHLLSTHPITVIPVRRRRSVIPSWSALPTPSGVLVPVSVLTKTFSWKRPRLRWRWVPRFWWRNRCWVGKSWSMRYVSHTLSHTPNQHILSYPVNISYQHTLSTQTLKTP